jgi:alkyl hydroperoxide reductase subunit AhpF
MLINKIRFAAYILAATLLVSACSSNEEAAPRSLLKQKDRDFFQEVTASFEGKAQLVLFTSPEDCEYCGLTENFLGELAGLSEKVSLQVFDIGKEAGQAAALGIERVPGTAILGGKDYGLRYYGLPTGYEFTSFVEAVHKAAEGVHGLEEATAEALAALSQPVMVTVFASKT